MLTHPSSKYTAFVPIQFPDRTWPSNTLTRPPIWLSTDLRDGNQALIEPMDIARKLRLFRTLVEIGFKEIEVGFPAASQTEFEFVRYLIEQNLVPEDVTLQVLTPAREPLIRRTFEALRGAKQVIVHLYNATDPVFRQVVFGLDQSGTIRLATTAAALIKQLAAAAPYTDWRFQYSPEVFTSTELSFAQEICNAVLAVWQPTPLAKAIINLPASVEVSTPNVFADQVEWMHRHLRDRESIILCVHPHNDRGCSVAAAELGQMAGAERVEGCLFGNGERTGNVDLVTLAMNLYSQGISPGLDFSRIDDIVRIAEDCTQLPVHPRHPYAGDLVFTAFSGSHQDAIKKGFAARNPTDIWAVPYLPMDPADVGRAYASVVRVNSQSGKGGIAFLLEKDYGVVLPRKLQIELSQVVQRAMDESGKEMSAQEIWEIFTTEYCRCDTPFRYLSHEAIQLMPSRVAIAIHLQSSAADNSAADNLEQTGASQKNKITLQGEGNGPIDALVNALVNASVNASVNAMNSPACEARALLQRLGSIHVRHYEERALGNGSQQQTILLESGLAIALIEIATDQGTSYGIGIHSNIVTASFHALISALNRQLNHPIALAPLPLDDPQESRADSCKNSHNNHGHFTPNTSVKTLLSQ